MRSERAQQARESPIIISGESTSEAGEALFDKHQTGLRVTFSWLEINLIIPFWAVVTENNALDHIAMTSQARS